MLLLLHANRICSRKAEQNPAPRPALKNYNLEGGKLRRKHPVSEVEDPRSTVRAAPAVRDEVRGTVHDESAVGGGEEEEEENRKRCLQWRFGSHKRKRREIDD
ncbi:unnamed protein product [Cuscuta campestris]|uniref:Uncharacterized protein n=1 Tax=Cuscuta campestris TaxID=132261 RepID=A0A484LS51_9ASTE|nr:unnamed protein product [Cuscuta campestris]